MVSGHYGVGYVGIIKVGEGLVGNLLDNAAPFIGIGWGKSRSYVKKNGDNCTPP